MANNANTELHQTRVRVCDNPKCQFYYASCESNAERVGFERGEGKDMLVVDRLKYKVRKSTGNIIHPNQHQWVTVTLCEVCAHAAEILGCHTGAKQ